LKEPNDCETKKLRNTNMKTILVPTDFSENAENALTYACELNKGAKARIIIFHSYHIPLPADEFALQAISLTQTEELEITQLNEIKDTFEKRYPSIRFEVVASLGLAVEAIENQVEKDAVDLIIMGTHGSGGIKEFLLGSFTAAVMENIQVPVLAIPENAVFGGLKTMVYALDFGHYNLTTLNKLVDFGRLFQSEITLLHFIKNKNERTSSVSKIMELMNHTMQHNNYLKISTQVIQAEDVYEGIHAYMSEFKPDMMVLSMRNRSFFQKVFGRSLTKRLAYHSHIPVLAMHESD
jgi:nucleotide-binding universal stress UspA family protein